MPFLERHVFELAGRALLALRISSFCVKVVKPILLPGLG